MARPASASVAAAFDHEAAAYDETFGRNPVGLYFRHVFQERLRVLLPKDGRVLDLGCGTGEDALFAAGLGSFVHGLDVSVEMVERARRKVAASGLGDRVCLEVRAAEDVGAVPGRFDAAYADFAALNCADLGAVGDGLRRVLRPGAPLLLSLMGGRPLPVAIERALTGRGEARGRGNPRLGGRPVAVHYPGLREVKQRLGPGFAWRGAFALGLWVPGPEHAGWARRHPQAFGILAALEGRVRTWPVLRALGDHVVLEGRRE